MLRRTLLAGAAAVPIAHGLSRPALAQGARRRVLRYVPPADVTVIDPVVTTAYVTRNHALMIWDQLYGLDTSLRPQPQMVEGHTLEDDGTGWTFRLRDGLKFHDGEPVRGRDCVASIRRWAQRDPFGQALLARTNEMTETDDRSFSIRLKRPFGAMLDTLSKLGPSALFIMPERLASTDPLKQIPEIVGSGPFRWNAAERVVGALAVYDRNPDYKPRASGTPSWAAGPKQVHFDRVEWVVMDQATSAAALASGEIDWWENPSNDLLPALERNRNITTRLASPLGDLGTTIFNHLQPPFDKVGVRRVMLEALAQEDFMIAVAGTVPNMRKTGIGIFTPGTPMANDAGTDVITKPRDLTALRRAMVEAGYAGERVVLMVPTDFPVLTALGEVCGDLMRKLGMNVDQQSMDWGTLVQRRTSKAAPDKGGWNIFNNTWQGLDSSSPMMQVLRTNGEQGYFGWPNVSSISALREKWLDARESADQKTAASNIQMEVMREVPFLPLGQFFYKTALRRDLVDTVDGLFAFWGARRV